MPNRVEQPIVRTSLPALNDINDQFVANNTPSASGATNMYAAQLGARVWLDGNVSPTSALIDAMCDARILYKRTMKVDEWKLYAKGWTNRIERVRVRAKQLAGASP